MKTYKTKDGYEVSLMNFAVNGTYEGLIMGSAEAYSSHILENPKEQFSRVVEKGKPLFVIKPEECPLPRFYWIAQLECREGVHTDDPDYNSCLYLGWYSDRTDLSIDAHLGELVKKFNWKKKADDYDITFV